MSFILGELGRRLLVIAALGDFLAFEVENLGDRHEAPDAGDIDNQAALVVVDDPGLQQFVVLILLFGDAPLAFGVGAFEREEGMSIRRLRLDDIHEHLVIEVKIFKGPVATRGQLSRGEDALRLETNIDQDLILVNPHDYAIDYIAALDIDGSGGCREQRFHFIEIVHLFRACAVVPLWVISFVHCLYPSAFKICRWHCRKVAVLLSLHG